MKQYLTNKELKKLGFIKIGKNCKVSNRITCYSLSGKLGNNVRIDDDVVLKGKIYLKNNIHIARGCTLSGGNDGINIDDFSAISNFVQLFTKSDHYIEPGISGGTLDNAKRKKFSKTISNKIIIGKLVLVGAFSIILPGAKIGDYSSIGAYSIIHKKIKSGNYFANTKGKEIIKKRNINELKSKYKKIKLLLNI